MNVLILGKGYVGNALKEEIPSAYHFSRAEFNYTDDKLLTDFIIRNSIDMVVNCAGYTGNPNVDACENNKEQCYFQNVILPQLILNAVTASGARLIHISSGCIYDGYDKVYIENDTPNFGIYSDRSSFYSKTKHIAESILNLRGDVAVVRLRIPFDRKSSRKNYFDKLLGYDNLINYRNSKTDLRYLCRFIHKLAKGFVPGVYNAVHSNALNTERVVEIMREYGLNNPNWKFVPYDQIPIKAHRSNCVLDNQGPRLYGFDFGDEEQAIREALEIYTK